MNKLQKFVIICVLALIISFFLIDKLGKQLTKQLYTYVNVESTRIVSNIVNSRINKILENNSLNELFVIEKTTNGEVELLDYNTQEVNRLLRIIYDEIYKDLLALEEGKIEKFPIATDLKFGRFKKVDGGVICEVPFGTLKNNSFYANYGPYIPLKMSFKGGLTTKIKTKLTSYGFNSLVVEVTAVIEIEERVSLPVSSKNNKIKIEAPLTIKIIQGIIPEQYYEKQLEKSYPNQADN